MNYSGFQNPVPPSPFVLHHVDLVQWQRGRNVFLWEVHWPGCACSHCDRARSSWWRVAVWFPSWKYMFRGGWKTGVLKLNGKIHYWRFV